MKRIIILFVCAVFLCVGSMFSAKWEDWELGGEMGLGYGVGSKSGRILCPALMGTATRTIENKFMELGLGYMFGSKIVQNYSAGDIDPAYYTEEEMDVYNDLVAGAGQDVKVRMSVIPMTVNFYYRIFTSFYVGGGLGLYHVFYKIEPLGDYRVNIDSQSGEIVKSPTTTAIGFQQMAGMEIFPLSKKWSWFIGLKIFFTTAGGPSGALTGMTFGGKIKYSW